MTGEEFFKKEHWILKIIYGKGITCLGLHFYHSFFSNENSQTPFSLFGFGIFSLFLFRMYLSIKKLSG